MELVEVDHSTYKPIPGHEQYGINDKGIIREYDTGKPVGLVITKNGYAFTVLNDADNGSLKAMAIPWSVSPTTVLYENISNGNAESNILSYTDYVSDISNKQSGSHYNSFNTGDRPENIPCKIRDFRTGEIIRFASLAQAAVYMGLRKDTNHGTLFPKQFGRLIVDIYELKYEFDNTPWFYDGRTNRVPPSRYLVIVKRPDGTVQEIFSNRTFLKEFQLYAAPYGKSMPNLALYAKDLYPELEFIVRDSYKEIKERPIRAVKKSRPTTVYATKDSICTRYESWTQCADAIGISRSVIKNRLDNDSNWNGWLFTTTPLKNAGTSSE